MFDIRLCSANLYFLSPLIYVCPSGMIVDHVSLALAISVRRCVECALRRKEPSDGSYDQRPHRTGHRGGRLHSAADLSYPRLRVGHAIAP